MITESKRTPASIIKIILSILNAKGCFARFVDFFANYFELLLS